MNQSGDKQWCYCREKDLTLHFSHLQFVSSKADCKLSKVQPYFTLQDENDKTLLFESRFESGNLMRAIKV